MSISCWLANVRPERTGMGCGRVDPGRVDHRRVLPSYQPSVTPPTRMSASLHLRQIWTVQTFLIELIEGFGCSHPIPTDLTETVTEWDVSGDDCSPASAESTRSPRQMRC